MDYKRICKAAMHTIQVFVPYPVARETLRHVLYSWPAYLQQGHKIFFNNFK